MLLLFPQMMNGKLKVVNEKVSLYNNKNAYYT